MYKYNSSWVGVPNDAPVTLTDGVHIDACTWNDLWQFSRYRRPLVRFGDHCFDGGLLYEMLSSHPCSPETRGTVSVSVATSKMRPLPPAPTLVIEFGDRQYLLASRRENQRCPSWSTREDLYERHRLFSDPLEHPWFDDEGHGPELRHVEISVWKNQTGHVVGPIGLRLDGVGGTYIAIEQAKELHRQLGAAIEVAKS